MATTLQDRVLLAIAAGHKVGQLAKAAKKTSSAVSQWKSGKSKEIKADSAMGLEKLTGWRMEWWISGQLPQTADVKAQPPSNAPLPDPIADRLLNAYEVLDAQERIALTESAERVAAEKLGRELLAKKMGVKNFSPTPNERVARHYGSPKNTDKGKT